MLPTDSFRHRIRLGFACVAMAAVAVAAGSFFALGSVIDAMGAVISDHARELITVRELEIASEQNVSSTRAFLLTGDSRFLEKAQAARDRFATAERSLRDAVRSLEEARLLEAVSRADAEHQAALESAKAAARGAGDERAVLETLESMVLPKRMALAASFADLVRLHDAGLLEESESANLRAARARRLVGALGAGAATLAAGLYLLSARTLRRLGESEKEVRELNERLESRVAERTRELRKLVGDLEGFTYAVAHNLRAPLRTMAGFSEITLQETGPRLDQAGKDNLLRIRNGAHEMDALIHGLLKLTRLSFTRYPLSRVDGARVVSDAIELKMSEIRRRGARVEIESTLPDFIGNRFLAELAVQELLSNALKFVTPGEPPAILVRGETREGRVRLWIKDNGIGIPAEHLDRIFGVFERLERAGRFTGVGIGLATTRRAVEIMGGKVGVSSRPGEGSEFWIDLPAAPPDSLAGRIYQDMDSRQV